MHFNTVIASYDDAMLENVSVIAELPTLPTRFQAQSHALTLPN